MVNDDSDRMLMEAHASSLRTIRVLDRPMRLFQSPLEGPDYPWAALVDLLAPSARITDGFQDYADRLAEQLELARYMLTGAGRELLVSAFVVDGILEHQAEEGSGRARQARLEFGEGMAEAFAMQHAHLQHDEFRRLCVIAAARHVPAMGQA